MRTRIDLYEDGEFLPYTHTARQNEFGAFELVGDYEFEGWTFTNCKLAVLPKEPQDDEEIPLEELLKFEWDTYEISPTNRTEVLQAGDTKALEGTFFEGVVREHKLAGILEERKETIMRIINLTPHAINFVTGSETITIEPSGVIARVQATRKQIGSVVINGVSIPVNKVVFEEVEGLPEPQEDTIFIVSSLVAQAVPFRNDVFIVDDTVRNEQGQIIGARAVSHV